MKFLRIASLILLPVIALALGFQIGMRYEMRAVSEEQARLEQLFSVSSGSGALVGDPEKEVDISLLWSVWRLLQQNYIEPKEIITENMVYGAIAGLVDGVGDPYTLFMTPKETKQFHDGLSGDLEGIGAQLDEQNGAIVVVSPVKGSPAEKAGLLPHDIITEVNGTKTAGMKLEEIVLQIRGPKGTKVTLSVVREGESKPLTMTITRDTIHIPSVESKVEGGIGILSINQFGDDTVTLARKELMKYPKDLKGLILDLRGNGGGYLEGAVELVSMFVKDGVVVTVHRRDVAPEEHRVRGSVLLSESVPMTVLVNGGSASAAEITAGALKDLGRASLIGTQTFGKGTVQEVIDLPGGSSLRVTIAKWLTPSGHDLGKKGITPDIIVDRTIEEYKAGKDPQMDKAKAWFQGKKDATVKKTATGAIR